MIQISWARLSITLQTRTMPFVGRHRLSKAARLSLEGFLVLAFAADLSTNHNVSKVFLKSKSNLRYFLNFHSLAEQKSTLCHGKLHYGKPDFLNLY